MSAKKTHEQRLSDATLFKGPDECWPWIGGLNYLGYGVVGWWDSQLRRTRTEKAHRLTYMTFVGPIPEELHVLHTCDNRGCQNPAHLWLGTHAENMHDMRDKGRRKGVNSGILNGRAKLTQTDADEIRILYKQGHTQVTLGEMFGVHQGQISKVVRNERWL